MRKNLMILIITYDFGIFRNIQVKTLKKLLTLINNLFIKKLPSKARFTSSWAQVNSVYESFKNSRKKFYPLSNGP